MLLQEFAVDKQTFAFQTLKGHWLFMRFDVHLTGIVSIELFRAIDAMERFDVEVYHFMPPSNGGSDVHFATMLALAVFRCLDLASSRFGTSLEGFVRSYKENCSKMIHGCRILNKG